MKKINIILASKSPQRKKIIDKLNFSYGVIKSTINEKEIIENYKDPISACKKIAQLKATEISNLYPKSLIIGADTIVYLNNSIIGKPKNKIEAFDILNQLSGKRHVVYTAVSTILKSKNINKIIIDKTYVTFNTLQESDIRYYIDNFEPLERAGAYGIQDWSSVFIKKIDGCYYNVVGFPLPKFYKLFKKIKRIL